MFGDAIDESNYRVANAPVSYPQVWDIWKFDWVQWNGSAMQPMARNIGEALGVGATLHLFDENGSKLPESQRYDAIDIQPGSRCSWMYTCWRRRCTNWLTSSAIARTGRASRFGGCSISCVRRTTVPRS